LTLVPLAEPPRRLSGAAAPLVLHQSVPCRHRTGRGHFISSDFVAAPAGRVMDLYRWFIAGHWRDATFL
jgi:hypothetical protein